MDDHSLLKHKTAIVTGGAQGIGREIALLFARQGATVAICDVVEDKGRETEAELRKISPASFFSRVDTGDSQAMMAFCRQVEAAFTHVDIVDNNVGINIHETVVDIKDENRERVFDVNLRSAFLLTQYFIPSMVERGSGVVLFTSTIHALATVPVYSSYAVSKGAIASMMRAIVAEYGDRGIRCNVIAPGGIRSSMWQQRMARMTEFELDQAKWSFSDPLAYHGECEDIANAHLFFASDMSKYITGQHFLVDTGAFIKLHAFPTYDYPDCFPLSKRLNNLTRNYQRRKGRDAMDIYDRLGVKKYINAWDTMSVIGGSRMQTATLDAMKEAAHNFVEIRQLHRALGDEIAKRTQNESAYITSGASAGILLTCAVSMLAASGKTADDYHQVPMNTDELARNEIVVMKGHRNPYDFAVRVSGARLVEAGRDDGCTSEELQDAISKKTAAVLFFDTHHFSARGLELKEVVRIAHGKGAFVIVDGAAQLPPKENLWYYTKTCGADVALFSGGKGLRGPQQGGLVVGGRQLIDLLHLIGPPNQGLGRSSKMGREEIVGVYTALLTFLEPGFVEKKQQYLAEASRHIISTLNDSGFFDCHVIRPGPTGQSYDWVYAGVKGDLKASDIRDALKAGEPGILVGLRDNGLTINPLNLEPEEIDQVIWQTIRIADDLAGSKQMNTIQGG